jgi:hypothetical protein
MYGGISEKQFPTYLDTHSRFPSIRYPRTISQHVRASQSLLAGNRLVATTKIGWTELDRRRRV